MDAAVLRPRCWSGKNKTFTLLPGLCVCTSPPFNAHSKTVRALLDVQTAPPCSPTNALMSAALFMYVTGTIVWPAHVSRSCSHASSVWSRSAMSAMLHPAPMSGKITRTDSSARMSAVSAMKCTPSKTTYFAAVKRAAYCDSSNESPWWSANSITSSAW